VPASPAKRITVSLATTPGPGGAIFATLADISGTGAVWADFAGTIGKVVDTSGTGINGAALKEAIRRGQIITVHRGTDGTHPTLVVEKVENPADAGSSLTLDALKDVTAPASTPAGKVLGTTGVGAWGPVDPPASSTPTVRATRPNATDRLVEAWDGTKWVPVYYDSGWRDLRATVLPKWRPSTYVGGAYAAMHVRRINNQIVWLVGVERAEDGGGRAVANEGALAPYNYPGFRPYKSLLRSYVQPLPNSAWGQIGFNYPNLFVLFSAGNYTLNEQIWTEFAYSTDDSIPTSLPGTLSTTAQ
jgi:hypothetical protein